MQKKDRPFETNTYSYNDQLANSEQSDNQNGVMDNITQTFQNVVDAVTGNDEDDRWHEAGTPNSWRSFSFSYSQSDYIRGSFVKHK